MRRLVSRVSGQFNEMKSLCSTSASSSTASAKVGIAAACVAEDAHAESFGAHARESGSDDAQSDDARDLAVQLGRAGGNRTRGSPALLAQRTVHRIEAARQKKKCPDAILDHGLCVRARHVGNRNAVGSRRLDRNHVESATVADDPE